MATGSSVHTTVNLIMAAKPLNTIVGQPTTKSMDQMMEQMAQMVAPFKTTAWGGLHCSLALVIDDTEYIIITRSVIMATDRIDQPPAVHPDIDDLSSCNASSSVFRWKPENFRRNSTYKKQ